MSNTSRAPETTWRGQAAHYPRWVAGGAVVTCERVNKSTIIAFPHHLLEITRGRSTDSGARGQRQLGNNLLPRTKWAFLCWDVASLHTCVPVCLSLETTEKNLKTSKKILFVICSHIIVSLWTRCSQQGETLSAQFGKNEHPVPRASREIPSSHGSTVLHKLFSAVPVLLFCIVNICHFQPWRIV